MLEQEERRFSSRQRSLAMKEDPSDIVTLQRVCVRGMAQAPVHGEQKTK